jgi:hypothetical protein
MQALALDEIASVSGSCRIPRKIMLRNIFKKRKPFPTK